jgi:fructose transport system substrate-binding protein
MKIIIAKSVIGAVALSAMSVLATSAFAADTAACLITKNNTNPFFVKMKEGAEAKAKEAGINLRSYAGKVDGDAGPQITAIENCMAAGAKGILITASNDAVVPALKRPVLQVFLLSHLIRLWLTAKRKT